ncbi:MAG: enoyl-CoA hydratase/isomerase family protein [Bacteroidales bacterium]|nr:MAG: enoyl-CoA hydratase/isomerase family protein [Bacteroidales bacterium]
MDLLRNKYIDVYTEEKIAIIRFKEKIFEFIVNLDESDTLIEFISRTQYDSNIKALLFINEPGSVDDKEYESFLKSILSEEYLMQEDSMPDFCEKNIRFKEINILNRIVKEIANYNKLCFVGIQGTIVTPFLGASLAADMRYAAENTVFVMVHNKYGLHPSGGLPFFLSQMLGHQKAMEVQLSEKITAGEALKLGMINKIFPEKDFLNNCVKEIGKFISIKSCTLRNTKRLTSFNRSLLQEYFDFEAGLLNL